MTCICFTYMHVYIFNYNIIVLHLCCGPILCDVKIYPYQCQCQLCTFEKEHFELSISAVSDIDNTG